MARRSGLRGGGALALDIIGGTARVDALFELLADLEERQALRPDVDLGARARVAAFVGLVMTDFEAAKAANLDALASLECCFHRVEHAIDDQLGLALGQFELVRDGLDQLRLGHLLSRSLTPRP